MTNVPDRIREFWKDIYILFDRHYLMDVSQEQSWINFWDDGNKIIQKYDELPCVIDLLSVVSELISKLAAARKKP